MNRISDEDLIGWLLGALEPTETDQIAEALETSPELRDRLAELQDRLAVLPERFVEIDPPVNLIDKTLNTIAINDPSFGAVPSLNHAPGNEVNDPTTAADVQPASRLSPAADRELLARSRQWSVMDMIVGAVVCFVVASLLLPSIANSRFESNLLYCQNNLRTIGYNLAQLADGAEGRFLIPADRDQWQASLFVQRMMEAGLVRDTETLICPNDPGREETLKICRQAWDPAPLAGNDSVLAGSDPVLAGPGVRPAEVAPDEVVFSEAIAGGIQVDARSLNETSFSANPLVSQALRQVTTGGRFGEQVDRLRRTEAASGSYGFPAPRITAVNASLLQIPGSRNDVLCADAACLENPGYRSRNHGGRGQNVLLGDLSVEFIGDTAYLPTGDHIYTNHQGRVQPVTSPGDNLIYRGVLRNERLGW